MKADKIKSVWINARITGNTGNDPERRKGKTDDA